MRNQTDKRTAPSTPACWQREAPSACLRIETSGEEMHVFPYPHLVTISLRRTAEEEKLRLLFSSHDVEIVGHNLRALVLALQDFAVKWIRPIPQRYVSLETEEAGVITSIRIEEAS